MRCFLRHIMAVELILLVGAASSVWAQTSPFFLPTPYATGASPTAVVADHFRGTVSDPDARVDLVVVNNASTGSISVFLGNGDGTFQTAVQYPTGGISSSALVQGDFNNDGKLDIAVLNGGSNTVAVLTGNGDGTFNQPLVSAPFDIGEAVAAGDFNNDGNLDLVVAGLENGLYLLAGDGHGGFTASVLALPPSGSTFLSVALSDLNFDGLLDIVAVANSGLGQPSTIEVFLNGGAGKFTLKSTIPASFYVASVVVGDANFDEIPDLITGSNDSATFNVLLGDGQGDFAAPSSSNSFSGGDGFFTIPVAITSPPAIGVRRHAVRPAQLGPFGEDVVVLNGYGFAVLINTDENTSGQLPIYAGPVSYGVRKEGPDQPANSYAAVADFNGDGVPDIAVVDFTGGLVWVSLAQPNSTFTAVGPGFQAGVDIAAGGQGTLTAVTAVNLPGVDVPGQGIAVTNRDANSVSVISTPVGNPLSLTVGAAPAAIVAGNFTGGGLNDLATANSGDGTVSVLLNTGTDESDNPTYAPAASYAVGSGPVSIATGDVNGDGASDLVVANSGDNTVSVLLGSVAGTGKAKPAGVGTFGTALSFPVGKNPQGVAVADLNGDGNQDIVAVNQGDNTVSVLLAQFSFVGGGEGFGFAQAVNYAVGSGPTSVVVSDFNDDFIPDLAVLNSADSTISILLGNGNGTFAAPPVVQLPSTKGASFQLATQDFNGDTNADLVVADTGNGQLLYLAGNGDGSFQAPVVSLLAHQPQAIAAGDFNGDGIADVVVANSDATDVTVILNATTSVASPVCGISGVIKTIVIGTQLTADVQCRGAFIPGSQNQSLLVNWDINNPAIGSAGTGPGGGSTCGANGNVCTFSPSICLPTGGYGPGGFTLQVSGSTASTASNQGISQQQNQSAITAIPFAVTPAAVSVATNATQVFNTPEPNACLTWSLSTPELSITPDTAAGKTDATYLAPASVPVPNTVNVLATYTDGTPATSATVTILVTQVAPAFTSAASVTFQTGVAGTFTVTTTGTPTPSISESGALPAGVTFVDNGDGTATLSGTPTQLLGGTFPLTFTAQNTLQNNVDTATQNFTLTLSSTNSSPAITSANTATFETGTQSSFTVTTTGKPAPSITETGALPSGVTFKDNGNGTATLSGTPAAGTGGVYTITFTAQNGIAPNATQSFTLDVPAIALTYPAFPNPAETLAGAGAGTIQFTAVVTGLQNVGVMFTVSGTGCSGACGTISQTGLYTPPATFTGSAAIVDTVTVVSLGDASLTLSVPVTVFPPAVAPPPPPVSLPAGQTATSALAVTGDTASVSFSFACVPTQFAQGAQCTVSPSSGALTSTPLNLSVNIQTTSQIASAIPMGGGNNRLFLAMFAPVIGVMLAGARWKRRRLWHTTAGILLILGSFGFLIACGTNGTFGPLPPPPPPNATPSGVYQLVIVAAPPGVDPQSSGASAIGAITVTVTNTPH